MQSGSKCAHGLRAFLCAAERGIGSHLEKAGVLYAHFVEFFFYGFYVAVFIKEGVGHYKRLLFVHYGAKLVERDGMQPFLKYNFSGVLNQSMFSSSQPRFLY
jgi:hypothetical protein